MKKIMRIAAYTVALLMTASIFGCKDTESSTESKNTHNGGYTEEIVEEGTDTALLSEFINQADAINYYNNDNSSLYSLAKGEDKFKSESLSAIDGIIDKDTIINIAISYSKDFFVSYYDMETGEINYLYVSADGTTHKIETDDYIVSAEFTPDNRLFVGAIDSVCEVNTSNYTLKSLYSIGSDVCAFDIINNNIITVDENGVMMYDYQNEKETEVPEALSELFNEKKNSEYTGELCYDICSGEDNTIYILTSKGIFSFMLNGNRVEQLIDGSKYQMGNPSNVINYLTYTDDGSFYVSFKNGMIVKYRFDSEIVKEKSSVLKVYSLEENDTLSQIVSQFIVNNKNIDVDYQVGMRKGVTYEDAVKNLTTQLLSGDAPDVMLMDGIDIDSYIDKNMLCNLLKDEAKWNPDNNLLDNIAKWDTMDNKLYSVACKFRIPAVGAEEKVLNNIKSYSDIADYVENTRKNINEDYAVLCMQEPESVIRNALIYEEKNLFSADGIDKNKLKDFFDDCSTVYKNDQPQEGQTTVSLENISDEYAFSNKLYAAVSDPNIMAVGTINTFEDDLNMATSLDGYSKPTDIRIRYGISEDSDTFIPTCNLGIIEAGANHDAAVKFIAEALNTETQKQNYKDGFPVNKDTLNYFYKKNENTSNNNKMVVLHEKSDAQDLWNIEWMSNEEVQEFDNYIKKLSHPYIIDNGTLDILIESGTKCLEGTISSEQAANDVIDQLELKMKE